MERKELRILVCGGRDWDDEDRIARGIQSALIQWTVPSLDHVVIIHGGARGADTLAGQVAKREGIRTEVYKADWDTYGKKAGYIRNVRMLEEGKPTVVLAAPGGRGTEMMVSLAKRAGVEVSDI